MSKPITLYSHKGGPNPWKVAIILEELGVPYETEFIEFQDMKKEGSPLMNINPNGRVPAIEDPNTGISMFEASPLTSMPYSILIGNRSPALLLNTSSRPTTRRTSSLTPPRLRNTS